MLNRTAAGGSQYQGELIMNNHPLPCIFVVEGSPVRTLRLDVAFANTSGEFGEVLGMLKCR